MTTELTPEEMAEIERLMNIDSVEEQQKYLHSGHKNFNVQSFREMMNSMCGDEITRSVPMFRGFVAGDDVGEVISINDAEEVETVQNQCILDNGHWGRHDCGTFKWHHGFKSYFKFSFKLRVQLRDR